MQDERDRFTDDLLDAALARHLSADPPAGMENRIVARLRAEPVRSSRFSLGAWARRSYPVAVAAAVIVAMLVVYQTRSGRHGDAGHSTNPFGKANVKAGNIKPVLPDAGSSGAISSTPAAIARVSRPSRQVKRRRADVQSVAESWARPPQFPTPAPLSEEERLLLRYVRETPREVLRASIEREKSLANDLEIPPLEIRPLNKDSAP